MKKLLIFLISVGMAGTLRAQSNETTPFITRSISGKSIQKIYARTSGGGITVTGITSGEPRLEVYVRPSNSSNILSKEEIQRILDSDYELSISTDNNLLSVTSKGKFGNMDRKKQLSISYKMFVSPKVSTDLSTSGGSIALSNLSGNQMFRTSGGGLNLSKLDGKIDGRTSGGSIDISDSKDDIDLNTSGGGIKATNCVGNINLTTSGGSLNLTGLKGVIKAGTSGGGIRANDINGEFTTHTSGGSINLDNIAASLDASTSGGGLNVSLKELGKYVKLNSSGGNISVDMPGNKGMDLQIRGNKIRTQLTNFNGSADERTINGKSNGGGVPVTVHANGNVNLNFK